MKLPVLDTTGKELRQLEVADEVFGIEPNRAVLHQAYVAQMANRRAGTASTKSRGEVAGSSAKIRRQKGLGRARQGSIRAPHRVGGGVVFGPRPHSFRKELPRQMRRLALRSALSSHAGSGSLAVIEGIVPDEPKTKAMQAVLDALGVQRTTVIISGKHEPTLVLATRNIGNVKVLSAMNLNVVDLVNAHRLLVTEDGVRVIEGLWGGENLKPARRRKKEAV